jgi:hypothetical protein
MYGGGMDPLIGLTEEDYRAIREKDKEDSYERRISNLKDELDEAKSNHELYKRVLQYVISLNKNNSESLLYVLEHFDKFFDYVKSNVRQEYLASSTLYNLVDKLIGVFFDKNKLNKKSKDEDKDYFLDLLYLQAYCGNNSDIMRKINSLYRKYRYEIKELNHESQEILDVIKYTPPTEEYGERALQKTNEYIYKWLSEEFREEVVMNMEKLTGTPEEVKEKRQRINEIHNAIMGIISIEGRPRLKDYVYNETKFIYEIFEEPDKTLFFH